MATYQRKRGIPARVWRVVDQEDDRGNVHEVASPDDAHEVRVWVFPQRSARAEVPGYLGIDIIRIGTDALQEGVDLWSKVEFMGKVYDVVTPPAYHHGTRHTRHWSMDLRARP
jgi:hypothetical protein